MKILYFYQYFTTPNGCYGTRVYEFSKRWVELGHDVTIITSVYSKSDIKAKKFIEDQIHDGIKVKVINVGINNKHSIIRRIFTFIQYMVISSWYALKLPADVVISSSGPITTGIPGLIAYYIRRKKFVFEVRDLWPQVAIDLNVIRNPWLIKLSYWLEKLCYKSASQIITLSLGMQNDIFERFKISKITTITNGANIELFSTKINNPDLKGLKPKHYAVYTGNIGEVNNSFWLFNAALILKERKVDDFQIVLIGEGQHKEKLLELKQKNKLNNFIILDSLPKIQIVGILQNALISLVPLKGLKILDTSSPNKFFESLAAGVPVIQNTNGWIKDFLDITNTGFTINPDNSLALADKIEYLLDNESILVGMSKNATASALEHFDKNKLADLMLGSIKSAIYI